MHNSTPDNSLALFKDSDFDAIFTDAELTSFLENVQENQVDYALPLQFLPPEGSSAMEVTGATAPAVSRCASAPVSAAEDMNAATSAHQLKALQTLLASQNGTLGQTNNVQQLAALQTLLTQQQLLQAQAAVAASNPLTSLLRTQSGACATSTVSAAPPPPPITRGMKVAVAEQPKPQVSHSTVEKQRRDRINALIDELRELVPPSKATQAQAAANKDAGNAEARRPKHVVLADTITLLKQMQSRGSLSALLAGAPSPAFTSLPGMLPPGMMIPTMNLNGSSMESLTLPLPGLIKEEQVVGCAVSPSNSNSEGSSHDDMEIREEIRTAAPKLPNIPVQPSLLAGVVVERGPDCMYIQVRCRDRKGLLLDIINALRQLPLEIKTASITTQTDGQVRDVFEVQLDDKGLQPEEIQNMVHEALFQQYQEAHKRARC